MSFVCKKTHNIFEPKFINIIEDVECHLFAKNSQYFFESQFINIIEDVECHLFAKKPTIFLSHNL